MVRPKDCPSIRHLTDAHMEWDFNLYGADSRWPGQTKISCEILGPHEKHLSHVVTQYFGEENPQPWWASWSDRNLGEKSYALFPGPFCTGLDHEGNLCPRLLGHEGEHSEY